jgi:prophage regulatory protein
MTRHGTHFSSRAGSRSTARTGAPNAIDSQSSQSLIRAASTPDDATSRQQDVSPHARAAPLRMLRFPAVRECTGLSRSTIWRLEQMGAFPRHRRLSANTVAWLEDEVVGWIRTRKSA